VARKSYEDFLNTWKNSDPDIPIYQQAKAEYAQLVSGKSFFDPLGPPHVEMDSSSNIPKL
jgi:hypothetical protein